MNTQIIAIANQKGGVGKTTTCANLGIGLAQAGKKVLLIDGDPQGSLTISLGHPQPDKLPFTLSDAMGRILMDEPLRPGEGILHHPEGVDLMPADIQLSGMEVSLVNAMSRETILRQYLDTLKGQYSHILIDCQPSLGMESYRDLILENIEYDHLCREFTTYREDLDEIVELMVETVCARRKTTRIAGSDFPHEVVRSRFLKLDCSHIEFVMECLRNNTTEIRNMKQYLLAVLFNAPTTISNHYTAQVNHDMYAGGW